MMRTFVTTLAASLAVSLCLAGCGPRAPDQAAVTNPAVFFSCGGTKLKATFQNDTLTLDVDGQSHMLMATMAASGARYETPPDATPHVLFWNKGREATLEVGNSAYPTCEQTDQQAGRERLYKTSSTEWLT